jgi:hypothetical protein
VVPAPAIARAAGKQEREPQMVVAGQRSAALAAALLRSARLLMPVLIAVLPCQMSSAARGSSVCEANAGLRELTRCARAPAPSLRPTARTLTTGSPAPTRPAISSNHAFEASRFQDEDHGAFRPDNRRPCRARPPQPRRPDVSLLSCPADDVAYFCVIDHRDQTATHGYGHGFRPIARAGHTGGGCGAARSRTRAAAP